MPVNCSRDHLAVTSTGWAGLSIAFGIDVLCFARAHFSIRWTPTACRSAVTPTRMSHHVISPVIVSVNVNRPPRKSSSSTAVIVRSSRRCRHRTVHNFVLKPMHPSTVGDVSVDIGLCITCAETNAHIILQMTLVSTSYSCITSC